VPFVSGLAFHS